jgi:hypothetical protein
VIDRSELLKTLHGFGSEATEKDADIVFKVLPL